MGQRVEDEDVEGEPRERPAPRVNAWGHARSQAAGGTGGEGAHAEHCEEEGLMTLGMVGDAGGSRPDRQDKLSRFPSPWNTAQSPWPGARGRPGNLGGTNGKTHSNDHMSQ